MRLLLAAPQWVNLHLSPFCSEHLSICLYVRVALLGRSNVFATNRSKHDWCVHAHRISRHTFLKPLKVAKHISNIPSVPVPKRIYSVNNGSFPFVILCDGLVRV